MRPLPLRPPVGLAILECEEAANKIMQGDQLEVNFDTGEIKNITKGESYQAEPFPPFIQKIIDNDGLVNYVKNNLKR